MIQNLMYNIKSNFGKKQGLDLIIFVILWSLGLFVHTGFFIAYILYLSSRAISDTYQVFKIAWNNPNNHSKPLLDNRSSGIPILSIIIGFSIWFYLYSYNYLTSELITVLSFLLIVLIIPTFIASFVLVYSIEFIQRYKKDEQILKWRI